jgi:LysR family hydrogen peroxide-inducible transcriptional activator
MISIQQMHYILVLSEERHFQRASERCFVTQPTLSMQIKKAEDTLGALIFDRSRNPLELTAFGEAVVPVMRDTLSEYARIEELVARSKGTFKEELRLGIIPTVAGYVLPDLYSAWQHQLEDVHLTVLEMKTEDLLQAMDQKKIDLGILAGPVHDPKMRTIRLYREEIGLYFPEGEQNEVNADTLRTFRPWLLTSGNCLRTQMMNFCELKESSNAQWDYEGGNLELLMRMVELHGGYTLVPEFYVQSEGVKLKHIVSSSGEMPAREIIAVTPNRSAKWKISERIIRSIQHRYSGGQKENLRLLNWH